MRFLVERGVRFSFYVIIGLSMVLVTTPDLSGSLHSAGVLFLLPVIGLLAWFVHLFEDAGKPATLLNHRPGRRSQRAPGGRMPAALGTGGAERA